MVAFDMSQHAPAGADLALRGEGPEVDVESPIRKILRDALLLALATYEDDVKGYLQRMRHRFTRLSISRTLEDGHSAGTQGRFVVAEIEVDDDEKYVLLAIRGSVTKEDWKANMQAWPGLLQSGGACVHKGWYLRSLELPERYLLQKAHDGYLPVVTGHSLGGAVAHLTARKLIGEGLMAGSKACAVASSAPHCLRRLRSLARLNANSQRSHSSPPK